MWDLLNEGVAAFLRRADKIDLHAAAVRDVETSTAGDIGLRLGAKTNLVANYRTRLVASGLIEPEGHGRVDFAIPGLRRHLRSKPRA